MSVLNFIEKFDNENFKKIEDQYSVLYKAQKDNYSFSCRIISDKINHIIFSYTNIDLSLIKTETGYVVLMDCFGSMDFFNTALTPEQLMNYINETNEEELFQICTVLDEKNKAPLDLIKFCTRKFL